MQEAEEEAIAELKAMTLQELDLVHYEKLRWICSGKGCKRSTEIRDYGIAPTYFHKSKIRFFKIEFWFWMCGKHAKIYKRLLKNYDMRHVQDKLFDFTKPKI